MEETDPIEDKFRSSFSDYEKEPPERVWEDLVRELHPELRPASFWSRIPMFSLVTNKPIWFYLIMGGFTFSLFVTIIYLSSDNHHAIRGHAYAGDVRLHSGSAELFQVADNVLPWDSATHYRSAIIDKYGHFQFLRVKAGKYLLRVAPDRNSDQAKMYLSSWYDRFEKSDSCKPILLSDNDINVEVHLIQIAK
ncbi:MAG: hypothetical protein Q8M08_11360 [Bacteroidales bacterium]|nr:hypothetical protein [Bacteroidales bacterium]